MFAYYIDHFSPFIIEFGHGIGIRWYGMAYVLGFFLGYQMLRWFSRHGYSEMPEEKVADFVAATALWGVLLGGRLGYALFYDLDGMLHEPLRFFRVWEGGMASHGGILGIVLFTLWYARRHKISWMGIGDNLVVAAPLGIFFGRCANFINGELYGRIAHVPWAMQFPSELLQDPKLAGQAVDACATIDPALTSPEAIVAAAQTSGAVRAALAGILNPRYPSQLIEAGLEAASFCAALAHSHADARGGRGHDRGVLCALRALSHLWRTVPRAGRGHPLYAGAYARPVPFAFYAPVRCVVDLDRYVAQPPRAASLLTRLPVIDCKPGLLHGLDDFSGGDPVGIVDDVDAALGDAGGVDSVHFLKNRLQMFFGDLIAEIVDFQLQFFEIRHQRRFRLA